MQGQTFEGLVPGVVIGDVDGGRDPRRRQGEGQIQRAGDRLLDVGGLGDQTDLAVLAEAATDAGDKPALALVALLAIAVGFHRRDADEGIPVAPLAGERAVQAAEAEGAGFELQHQIVCGGAAGGGDHVDRAAQLGTAEAKGVGTLVDLDVAGAELVDALEVGEAVGVSERHAVLGEEDAALVEALGDARAADGEAAFLTIALLGEDAGDVPEAVGEALGEAGCIALGGHHGDGAGGAAEQGPGVGDDGGVFGIADTGDDDRVQRRHILRRRGLGMGGNGEGGSKQQRARRCGGLERHDLKS